MEGNAVGEGILRQPSRKGILLGGLGGEGGSKKREQPALNKIPQEKRNPPKRVRNSGGGRTRWGYYVKRKRKKTEQDRFEGGRGRRRGGLRGIRSTKEKKAPSARGGEGGKGPLVRSYIRQEEKMSAGVTSNKREGIGSRRGRRQSPDEGKTTPKHGLPSLRIFEDGM